MKKNMKHRFAGAVAAAVIASASAVYCPVELFPAVAGAVSELAAPGGFSAAAEGSAVKLKWNKVKGADAYRVFVYDPVSRKYKSVRTSGKTSVSLTGLSAGTYRFKVAALVKKNGKYSVRSRSGSISITITDKEKNMTDRITINTQSSIRIDCNDLIVRIDPFRISGEPHDADIILITHAHYDHFSPEDIRKVSKSDTVIAAPKSMKKELNEAGITDAILLGANDSAEIRGISVETVRAYNQSKAFHPKSNNWLGYVVTVLGNRIYAAGDTDAVREAKAVKCDIALVPVGGTYTMDAKEAAELVNAIKPETAIPIHYGSIVGTRSDGEEFAKLVDKDIKVVTLL